MMLTDTPTPQDAPTPDSDQVLASNERTLVVRRRLVDGRSVVIKRAFGTDAQERLRHEAALLERLRGVPGLVQIAPQQSDEGLTLCDQGGQTLSQWLQSHEPTVAEMIDVAAALAEVVARLHQLGIVHKDINPSNVLLTPPGLRPVLIDFNIASSFAQEQMAFSHERHIEGTLAYMPPEQTGRTGRMVDQRSDLYALGATLYEMVTGRRPFESDDLLEVIHDHLVREPLPPAALKPHVPELFSDILMRLLAKDADRRYQSAEGLARDLQRLKAQWHTPQGQAFELGQDDFPLRLSPPASLVGRQAETTTLQHALDQALSGQARALLVAGAPGVGKSALINELQPMVSRHRGWFVTGKFEQYQREQPSAIVQVLRALGRLLLAEPEVELEPLRQRILQHVGANAGLGATLLPEFVTLLGPRPRVEVDNPQEAEKRMIQASVDLLRAVVSAERPLVMVIDDLQWAPAVSLRFLDALFTHEQPMPGLLVVGAYRAADVDAMHPLSSLLKRWAELGVAPAHLALSNLPAGDITTLIAQMLRLPPEPAQALGQVLIERTDGNPYDTVELVNALRHEGLLTRREGQWHWDEAALRHHVSDCDVVGLLHRRITALPPETRHLLDTMACLGGEASMALLQTASELTPQALNAQLAPALEDGLVVCRQGHEREFKFRHDRVQQAVHEGLQGQSEVHLALARRLLPHRSHQGLAAQQYLQAVQGLSAASECRQVIGLFLASAAHQRVVNFELCERFLHAALTLLAQVSEPGQDRALWLDLHTQRHAALYGLGQLEQADAEYAALQALQPEAMELVDPACVQIASLSNRSRHKEAMAIGLALLEALGLSQPEDLKTAIGMALMHMSVWIAGSDKAQDISRPELSEPRLLALSKVLSKTQVTAFFCAAKVGSWLTMASHRLWVEHGPCPDLMATLCSTPMQLIAIVEDYQGAYTLSKHLLAVGEARGYEPATSVVRFIHAMCCSHWYEPLEHSKALYLRAREGLLQAGDLQYGIFTHAVWSNIFDTAPQLNHCEGEILGALNACARNGDTNFLQIHRPSHQLYNKLAGNTPWREASAPGSLSGDGFDEAQHLASLASPSISAAYFHAHRSLASALFEDEAGLHHHTAEAMANLSRIPGNFLVSRVHALRAWSLAQQLRAQPAPENASDLLAQLDKSVQWLKRRAKDAPGNYLHLWQWAQAERDWATGDLWAAMSGLNTAMTQAQAASRPWQAALITERAAHFHASQGMAATAQPLLQEALSRYQAWGAHGKVAQLRHRWPELASEPARSPRSGHAPHHTLGGTARHRSTVVSRDMVDVLSVLRASQALSSETSLSALTHRVGKVLGAMTGAESVLLAVRESEAAPWQVLMPGRRASPNAAWRKSDALATTGTEAETSSAPASEADVQTISLEQAVEQHRLALAPFRYCERTREPLVLNEPARDERFHRDPAIVAQPDCALLILPVLSKGELRAMLVLENRQSKGAFSDDRLDAVTLIAGQLSVSLDNALLYASLEERVAERTAALEAANRQLELLSATDGLTGVANRRRFDEAYQSEWLRARRAGTPIGLVLIDIDHFKRYNDHYGHQGGDACLKMVASVMASGLRAGSDLVARYGGEEFVLLLANTDLAGTQVVAERVRAAVQAVAEPHAGSEIGVVTISVGVTSFVPKQGQQPAHCIVMADQALYEAKRTGRNRVCVAT